MINKVLGDEPRDKKKSPKCLETETCSFFARFTRARRFIMGRVLFQIVYGFGTAIEWTLVQFGTFLWYLIRNGARQARQTFFGNWRRGLVSSAIISLVVVNYFPRQTGPIVHSLWTIVVTLIGIWVMTWGLRQLLAPPRRRRRNRDRD
jgi:hypothetical protein